MRIAVQGCCHGELNKIYRQVELLQQQHNYRIDLLLVCGDFQALRDGTDLEAMACPDKYKRMGDFREYHSGARLAPLLTIFIGGNHEASNFLADLYLGGWVAPRIYYLGHSGCVQVSCGGERLRIAGYSGIYAKSDWQAGYFERFPFPQPAASARPGNLDKKSCYHTRAFEILKLSHVSRSAFLLPSYGKPKLTACLATSGQEESLILEIWWLCFASSLG